MVGTVLFWVAGTVLAAAGFAPERARGRSRGHGGDRTRTTMMIRVLKVEEIKELPVLLFFFLALIVHSMSPQKLTHT